jgi:hypothetical protein
VHLDPRGPPARAGTLDGAEQELRAFLVRHPEDLTARFQLGELHQQRGRFKHAAEIFKGVLEKDPRHAEAHRSLARSYRKLGEPEKAIAVLEQAMAVEGSRAEAAGLDSLRDTLDLYEDTVAEYAPEPPPGMGLQLAPPGRSSGGPRRRRRKSGSRGGVRFGGGRAAGPAAGGRGADHQIGGQEPVLRSRGGGAPELWRWRRPRLEAWS